MATKCMYLRANWPVSRPVFSYLPYRGKFLNHSSVTTWENKYFQLRKFRTFGFLETSIFMILNNNTLKFSIPVSFKCYLLEYFITHISKYTHVSIFNTNAVTS
jgi:hypothetical protein